MAITLLAEDVINKIAAGEVIERPASVVKELVENSLDAGATSLLIEIEKAGKERIRLTDNGSGMSEEDARKSILRHATSKIKSAEDLFSITTLGFRGEALASIAAVSSLTLTTKQKESLAGFNLVVEGGVVLKAGMAAADQGTTVSVRSLFFNTPARKKFLKTDAVELRHIIDVVTHYALINPQISFRLLHDGRELLYSPAAGDLRNTIASVYGVTVAKELLEVAAQEQGVSIRGFVCKPYHARNDRHQQALFVNGRWIKNADLVKAVYEGYHALLFVNKHPLFVLQIALDPEKIDVNVHPQKADIRIEQKELVCSVLTQAIREALRKQALVPTISVQMEEQLTFGTPPQLRASLPKDVKYTFEPTPQQVLQVREAESIAYEKANDHLAPIHEISPPPFSSPDGPPKDTFPPLKLLGQVHKTFFVAETPGGVFFIDQHAAHERVLYEQLMTQLASGALEIQQLLQGEVMELTPAEAVQCREHLARLEEFGFHLEAFGGNSFLLKTAPVIFGRQQVKNLCMEIIDHLGGRKNRIHELREGIITRMACRAAVMAGEELTNVRMEKILAQLRETKFPYTCPHGRPTLMKTTTDELEKKFRRK